MNKMPNTYILIVFVYIVTVLIRFSLAFQTFDSPMHTLDGEFLSILTYDAAVYAYYANLLLEDIPHTSHVFMIEYIIYYLVKFTPLSLDQVMYFTPAFLSSLIVIPTMLLALLYIHSKTIVVLLGLTAGVGYGYYSRTHLGYFDTDVLNTFFPMFILYGMILTLKKANNNYLWIIIVSNILYLAWYHSSLPLIYTMNGFFILYSILNNLKTIKTYTSAILLAVSISTLFIWYKLILLLFIFIGSKYFKLNYKYFILLFLILILLTLYNIDINSFSFHAKRYIFKEDLLNIMNFKFIAPMQHISEAKSTNFLLITNLISGNIFLFFCAVLGYMLLVFKHKEMILALPMVVLGLLSVTTGTRFHIYVTALFSLSYFYIVYYIIINLKLKNIIFVYITMIFTIPVVYENYKIIKYWNTQGSIPSFYPEQVNALKNLQKIIKKDDYAITWWDYGYPILYYSGLKTIINNGIHHADNYTVAHILLSHSQKFTHHASHYFYDIFAINRQEAIVQALQKTKNVKKLFNGIENNTIKVDKKVDKYIILPIQMSPLIYTIYKFANIDPITGKKIGAHTFKTFSKLKEDKDFIYLTNNSKIDKKRSILTTENIKVMIKQVSNVSFKNGVKKVKRDSIKRKGVHLVILGNQYYIMGDYFYYSSLVQMMFFNNYDKNYFLSIYEGETISIYKVK